MIKKAVEVKKVEVRLYENSRNQYEDETAENSRFIDFQEVLAYCSINKGVVTAIKNSDKVFEIKVTPLPY